MKSKFVSSIVCFGVRRGLALVVLLILAATVSAAVIPNLLPFLDPTGFVSTFNSAGKIDTSDKNPFLKTSGRTDETAEPATLQRTAWVSAPIIFRNDFIGRKDAIRYLPISMEPTARTRRALAIRRRTACC